MNMLRPESISPSDSCSINKRKIRRNIENVFLTAYGSMSCGAGRRELLMLTEGHLNGYSILLVGALVDGTTLLNGLNVARVFTGSRGRQAQGSQP